MRRFGKGFHRGEDGLTLIELLIVIAIIGILFSVVAISINTFIVTGKLAAANTEVVNVKTAALAYYADNAGGWPDTSDNLTGTVNYLDEAPDAMYYFNLTTRFIDSATAGDGYTEGLSFNATGQQWER